MANITFDRAARLATAALAYRGASGFRPLTVSIRDAARHFIMPERQGKTATICLKSVVAKAGGGIVVAADDATIDAAGLADNISDNDKAGALAGVSVAMLKVRS